MSGNPAYALYDEPYRRYFKSRGALASDSGLDEARRWVFFPENYNWAFYEPPMLEQMIRDGQSAEQVYAMRDLVTRSFEVAMRWCAALARRGEVEVIIRPRPATPLDVFRRRVEAVLTDIPPGMSIVQRDTVRDWVLASDVVMSSYSTTLIEGSMAGKPAFIVEPIAWPESLRQQWHSLVPRVRTEDEFIAASTDLAARADDALGAWARSTLMAKGDPILRIADQLAAIHRGSVPVPAPAPWWSITPDRRYPLLRGILFELRFELRRRLLPLVLPPGPREIAAESLEDVAALDEVPDRVQRWRPLLDDYLASLEEATP